MCCCYSNECDIRTDAALASKGSCTVKNVCPSVLTCIFRPWVIKTDQKVKASFILEMLKYLKLLG